MIRQEHYKTREDGVPLLKIWSDTDRLIRKNGVIYECAIDISSDGYQELDELVKIDGPETYEEVVRAVAENELSLKDITRKINRLNLTAAEALSVKTAYPKWEDKVGCTIEQGYITLYSNSLWRARQSHLALSVYPPSIATASLYEMIEKDHDGSSEDPIPYSPPMEIFEGKYYVQDDMLYRCIRDSGMALVHNLHDLTGTYVELN